MTKGHFGHQGENGQVLKHPQPPPLHVPALNMLLAKAVLFTLLGYPCICSQRIQMSSRLFMLSHLNKQFYTEQYCASSQHCSLKKTLWQLLRNDHWSNFYWLNLCCCCFLCQVAVIWIRVFTELPFVHHHHLESVRYGGICGFHCNFWTSVKHKCLPLFLRGS